MSNYKWKFIVLETVPVFAGLDGQHVFLQRDLPAAFFTIFDLA